MNAKQSERLLSRQQAQQKIRELEYVNVMQARDIQDYNACIDSMIQGGSPCDWCEDQNECQLQAKADGKGCESWWLRYRDGEHPADLVEPVKVKEDTNDSEGIVSEGQMGGERAENAERESGTLS